MSQNPEKRYTRNPLADDYPVFLDLRRQKVLVVGGGTVAERKVRTLLPTLAQIHLVCPAATTTLQNASRSGRIRWSRRPFRARDIKGARLVFAATDDLSLNRSVARHCHQNRIPVNVASPSEDSTFRVPALARQGDLRIAISTGGKSPALAKWLRQNLEKTVCREFGRVAGHLGSLRKEILDGIPDTGTRQKILNRLVTGKMLERIRTGEIRAVRREIRKQIRTFRILNP